MSRLLLIPILAVLAVCASPGSLEARERTYSEAKATMLKGLRSGDVAERANAVYELDGFDTPDAARTLVRWVLMRDDRARVLTAGVQLLGALRNEDSLKALIAQAKGGPWLRRARVLEALGKTRSDAAFEAILAAAYDEDSRVRASALQALEFFKDMRCELALIDGLEADAWPVRSVAVEVLMRRSSASAIPGLIARLVPGVEAGRLRGDVAAALATITQKNFGLSYSSWKHWYDLQKDGPKPPAPTASKTPLHTASLAGIRSWASRVTIVLAVHKSMSDKIQKRGAKAAPAAVRMKGGRALEPWLRAETKIELARLWVAWTVENLSPEVHFNIVTYGASGNAAFSDFVPATPSNKTKAIRRVTSLSAGGNSNLFSGLEQVFQLVNRDILDQQSMVEGPEVVFFVSDGASEFGEIKDAYRAFEEAERWNRYRQIRFHCIGIGEHDSRVMVDLSSMPPAGRYKSLP